MFLYSGLDPDVVQRVIAGVGQSPDLLATIVATRTVYTAVFRKQKIKAEVTTEATKNAARPGGPRSGQQSRGRAGPLLFYPWARQRCQRGQLILLSASSVQLHRLHPLLSQPI